MDADEKQRMMEEHMEKALSEPNPYFEKSKPTFIENWPRELCSLSIAQAGTKLTLDQAERLGKNLIEFGAAFYPDEVFPEEGPPSIEDIRQQLRTIVDEFPLPLGLPSGSGRPPGSYFVRLGSRSPKDAYGVDPVIIGADQALERLCAMSERVFEDLSLALHSEYEPYIWLRQWMEIAPWAEFRCFQKDGKLVGISEYDYLSAPHPEIAEHHESIEWAIRHFWETQFRHASHLDDVIFDVFLMSKPGLSTRDIRPDTGKPSYQSYVWECKLLEINPLFTWTDPCLFDWRDPDCFDGSFRWRDQS